ncbi:DEAD/DEAH box helicase [Frigoribacterium sp. PhB24]|uniref:DEAD/DEAH box helicase n=1 Tax=Frigoribacterium sp. PhB24 TaxID=2485204 RepID=UPI0011CDEB04|nr:DEAD/DEAH box helicase [Frigoribacterium sp. PhB24]
MADIMGDMDLGDEFDVHGGLVPDGGTAARDADGPVHTTLVPLVDAVDVIRLVGPRAFNRAKEYVRDGAVLGTVWHPADERLEGTVQGAEATPYQVVVDLRATRGEYSRPVASRCSCPIGADCKHVAATLLQSNSRAVADRSAPSPSADDLRTGGVTALGAARPGTGGGDWRSTVGAIGRPSRTSSARTTRMGLLFDLRDRAHSTRGRAVAPSARRQGGPTVQRLGVRPVTLSGTGNWVRGNLTWSSLPYQLNRLAIEPEQHAWFGQFAALHRSAVSTYTPGDADWLIVDDFASPLLWPLLAEAERLGISLVTGKRSTDVVVGDEARVTVDAVRGDDGSVVLTAGVTVDGVARRAESTGVIADHGVWCIAREPVLTFTLAPTVAPLDDEQRRLVTVTPEVVVPAADSDEFLRDYYPTLRRRVDVVSSDASIEFPTTVPPVLTLTVGFEKGQTIRLSWGWTIDGAKRPLTAHSPLPDLGDLDVVPRDQVLTGVTAAEFATGTLPTLEARPDLRVDLVGTRPDYRELTDEPRLTITTMPTDKRDWFDLGVFVTVEGRTVPFTPLIAALAKGRKKLLLVDHSYLSLDHPAFDELKRLIDEASALDEWQVAPRINRYQASLWSELDDLADETIPSAAWQQAVGGLLALADSGGLEAATATPVPATVDATLRPYQHEGFAWLAFLHEHGLGGVLADDMGLGKTLQTLALVAHVREVERSRVGDDPARAGARTAAALAGSEGPSTRPAPFLVVAPTSVVSNWVAEASRFTPGLTVRAVTATQAKGGRGSVHDLAQGADVVVTSYALFRLDFAAYQAERWAGLILDEAQFVKNRASQAHRCAVDLDVPFKLAITGTPLENSLTDLWSLLHVVAPGLLGSSVRFADDYVKPIATGEAPDLLQKLRKRIRPVMMRRTKEQVASDLPAKQEQLLRVDLDPAHRDLYDAFLQRERQKLLGLMDDLDRNRFIVFRSLTLLRLLSLDASLVDEAYADVPSAKLDQLLDELDDVVAEGHRALVFSQFTTFLHKVAARLERRGVAYEYLDGSTRRRGEVIERFKTGDAPAFLISLKAGGFGLNLTEADYVFILDPWWNPATEAQAVDRTHRIGQTDNVMVYRMIANDTIEEKVLALQAQKSRLFDAVMDDDAVFSAALTADDIRGLLDA